MPSVEKNEDSIIDVRAMIPWVMELTKNSLTYRKLIDTCPTHINPHEGATSTADYKNPL